MNKFMLEINLGNETMGDALDVAVALTDINSRLHKGITAGNVWDTCGNNVGRFWFE